MNAPITPLRPREIDGKRRTFLKAGIAGSALLLFGRWLPAARAANSIAQHKVAYLTSADAAVLARVIPVMLLGALPQDPEQLRAAVDEIILGVDITIGYQPPSVRGEIRDLFGLLTKGVTRALVAGVWTSWENASNQDVRKFLLSWRGSRLNMLRSAYIGLNNLIVASWYGNPRSWPRIGYPGPPKLA